MAFSDSSVSSRIMEKAKRLFFEGRVKILSMNEKRLEAEVKGDTDTYIVSFTKRAKGGQCQCQYAQQRKGTCSHAIAVTFTPEYKKFKGID